jgi:PEP phosphonomutase and related enzymes
MTTQYDRANILKNLHVKGDPLILFNIWDAGSAKAIMEAGAKVLATSSWAVAMAHGCEDGEKLSFDLVLANFKRIIANVDLPVTVDLEGGYNPNPSLVHANVIKIIEAGAVGINFEDQIVGGEGLYSVKDQCARIKAARKAADLTSIPIFINARTDIFFKADPTNHDDTLIKEALLRVSAYTEAGANGFFVPGLRTTEYIEKLCKLSPLPINVMILPNMPSVKQLAASGVARISYGPGPYCLVMDALKEAGRKALASAGE